MVGNWSDSNSIDEAKEYLKSVNPDLIKYLNLNSTQNNIHSIVSDLQNHTSHDITSLLKLCLDFRVFNPKASLKNPIRNKKPVLKGLSLLEESNNKIKSIPNINLKLFSYIFKEIHNSTDNFNKLRNLLQNFDLYLNDISNTDIDKDKIIKYQKLKLPYYNTILQINSRQVNTNLYDFIDNIIEETKFQKVLDFFNFSAEEKSKIHDINIGKVPNIFVEMPNIAYGAVIRDVLHNQYSEKYPTKVDFSAQGDKLYLVKKNLLTVQIFVKLFDPSSKKILEKVLDELKIHSSLTIVVFPIFRASNKTELKAAFAFRTILRYFDGRTACRFLLDGLTMGYEQAYEKLNCEVTWNLLNFVMDPTSSEYISLESIGEFILKHNITENLIFVNGNPIFDKNLNINDIPKMYDPIIRKQAKENLLENVTLYNDVGKNQSIILDRLNISNINQKQFFADISKFDITKQINIIDELYDSKIKFQSTQNNSCHVFIFGEIDQDYSGLLNDPIIIHQIENPSKTLQKFIKNAKVLIGAQIFDHVLDASMIKYHVYSLIHSLPCKNYSKPNLYLTMWHQAVISRSILSENDISNIPDEYKFVTGTGPMKVEIVIDPFEENVQYLLEFLKILADRNISTNYITLSFNFIANHEIPYHLRCRHVFDFENDFVEYTNENYSLVYPNNFVVSKENNKLIVSSIGKIGVTSLVSEISVNNEINHVSNDGYFIVNLPVGKFDVLGLKTKVLQIDSFNSYLDEFIPDFKSIYTPQSENNILNVFSTNYENNVDSLLAMMYTLSRNSANKVKFWICGSVLNSNLIKYDFRLLPIVFPPSFVVPQSKLSQLQLAKITLVDILLPKDVDSLLICDKDVIWQGNAARFLKLDNKVAVVAMPDISNKTEKRSRPYHSSALSYVFMSNWRKKAAGYMRELFTDMMQRMSLIDYAEELIDVAQKKIQVMTLPLDTCYCEKYGNITKKPLSIHICTKNSYKYVDEDYENLINKAKM